VLATTQWVDNASTHILIQMHKELAQNANNTLTACSFHHPGLVRVTSTGCLTTHSLKTNQQSKCVWDDAYFLSIMTAPEMSFQDMDYLLSIKPINQHTTPQFTNHLPSVN
jgi:hypothetical protein